MKYSAILSPSLTYHRFSWNRFEMTALLSVLRPLVFDTFVDPVNLSNIALVALVSVSFALALRPSAEKVTSMAWVGGAPVHAEMFFCHGSIRTVRRPDENMTFIVYTMHRHSW